MRVQEAASAKFLDVNALRVGQKLRMGEVQLE